MGIMGVLFNPNGRIQANQFWQGVIVLVGLQIVLQVLAVLGINLGILTGIIGIGIVYPYLCVYGKRLHDSNKTAWMFLLFVLGHMIIIVASFFFIPGIGEFFEQYMAVAQEGDQQALEALIAQYTEEVGNAGMIIGIVGLLVSNLVLGFLVARMFSDPNTNKYGPPVGGEVAGGGQAAAGDDDIFS